MAFLIFLFVMGCLLFVDCRLVYVGQSEDIQWQEPEPEDDQWECWEDEDASHPLRVASAIRKKESDWVST